MIEISICITGSFYETIARKGTPAGQTWYLDYEKQINDTAFGFVEPQAPRWRPSIRDSTSNKYAAEVDIFE